MNFNLVHGRDDSGDLEDPLRLEDVEIGKAYVYVKLILTRCEESL
jgi:hypothetical protein